MLTEAFVAYCIAIGEPKMAGEYDGRAETLIARVIEDEGGYVDHPDDKGGPTKYGITKAFYKEAFGVEADTDTIKNLTKNDARRAYHKVIWQKYKVHMLPTEIQPVVFDWMVMSGPSTPVKFLQRRVGVKPDGIIGSKTAAAVREKIQEVGFTNFQDDFVSDIVGFLTRIIEKDPSQTVFRDGWFNRFCEYYGASNDTNNAGTDNHTSDVQPTSGQQVRDAGRNGGASDRTPKVALEKGEGKGNRGSRGGGTKRTS